MRSMLLVAILFSFSQAMASSADPGDYLVKVRPAALRSVLTSLTMDGSRAEQVTDTGWVHVQVSGRKAATYNMNSLYLNPSVLYVQPNYKLSIRNTFSLGDIKNGVLDRLNLRDIGDILKPVPPDNPEIPAATNQGSGADPQFSQQWGMQDIGVKNAWTQTMGNQNMVVAVIDTGVDYTHEDLVDSMWRNPGESGGGKETNGIDDDHNGFVDDVVGWDFASKDNKPFDLPSSIIDMLTKGGNPGHGTHCAGNVGAHANNGKGIAGVAPNVKIMALRFITDKGEGTTADAISAIQYAVKNGAKVTSNSWGSEGEDPQDPDNQALISAIKAAQDAGALFVAAAGNGHQGVGYDNDTDAKPGIPASYDMDNIISVAALDANGALGAFSNWGNRTVDIGAPGVKVFSTTPTNGYQDTVINLPQLGLVATWDGTSMATPHVAGAAALYWSKYPNKTWKEVKDAVLKSAKPTSSLSGKAVTGGRLDVDNLLNHF